MAGTMAIMEAITEAITATTEDTMDTMDTMVIMVIMGIIITVIIMGVGIMVGAVTMVVTIIGITTTGMEVVIGVRILVTTTIQTTITIPRLYLAVAMGMVHLLSMSSQAKEQPEFFLQAAAQPSMCSNQPLLLEWANRRTLTFFKACLELSGQAFVILQ